MGILSNKLKTVGNVFSLVLFTPTLFLAIAQFRHINYQDIYIQKLEGNLRSSQLLSGWTSGIPKMNMENLINTCNAEPQCMLDIVISYGFTGFTVSDMKAAVAISKRH